MRSAKFSNSLVGYSQSRQYRIKLEEQTNTYKKMRLANVRFQGGVTSFLEVQYNEQQYFCRPWVRRTRGTPNCKTTLALYQAFGGGWQP